MPKIEPIVKDALENAAKADRRTVAAYVEKLIVDDLEANGFLQKDWALAAAEPKPRRPPPTVNLGYASMKTRRPK
jgi:hypothetical protein